MIKFIKEYHYQLLFIYLFICLLFISCCDCYSCFCEFIIYKICYNDLMQGYLLFSNL